jgi:HEPN domain-containing protein
VAQISSSRRQVTCVNSTRSLMKEKIGRNKQQDSTAGAFLHMARQYHDAARKLFPQRESIEMPLYFLYAHAIELLFKAYLRSHGLPIRKSHDLGMFLQECRQKGLRVHLDLENLINLLESENKQHGFRYYRFASTIKPEISYVSETVDKLMAVVSERVVSNPEIVPKKTFAKLTVSKLMPIKTMSLPPSNV